MPLFRESTAKEILQLFSNYQRLVDMLRDKSGGATGGRKGRPAANTSVAGGAAPKSTSMLSVNFVAMMMAALYK